MTITWWLWCQAFWIENDSAQIPSKYHLLSSANSSLRFISFHCVHGIPWRKICYASGRQIKTRFHRQGKKNFSYFIIVGDTLSLFFKQNFSLAQLEWKLQKPIMTSFTIYDRHKSVTRRNMWKKKERTECISLENIS